MTRQTHCFLFRCPNFGHYQTFPRHNIKIHKILSSDLKRADLGWIQENVRKKTYNIETDLRHLETIGLLETFRFRYLLQNQLPRISHHEKSNTSEIQKSPDRGSFSIKFKKEETYKHLKAGVVLYFLEQKKNSYENYENSWN